VIITIYGHLCHNENELHRRGPPISDYYHKLDICAIIDTRPQDHSWIVVAREACSWKRWLRLVTTAYQRYEKARGESTGLLSSGVYVIPLMDEGSDAHPPRHLNRSRPRHLPRQRDRNGILTVF